MKKLCALLGVAALVSITPATPTFAQNNGATVTEGWGCNGFVPAAGSNDFPGDGVIFTSDETHSVVNNPKKGSKVTIVCHFDVPEELIPDSVRKASGFLCSTDLGFTTDTRMLATPDGDATLICRLSLPAA